MADFWAAALGYVRQPPPPGYDSWDDFAIEAGIPEEKWDDVDAVVDPDGVGPRLFFERWEAGEPNKRVHLDVNALAGEELSSEEREERLAEERRRLETLGARFHRVASGVAGETWVEMFDPEGNWFCVQ
jgi:hypothetical protein